MPERSAEMAGMQRLLENVPDAIVVVDAQGLIVMINSQFERLLGWRQADLVGQCIEVCVPAAVRAGHRQRRAGYVRDLKFRTMGAGMELYALRRDGTEFPAQISLASAQTDAGPLVTVALRDLSERRAMEEKFRHFVESSPDAVVISDQHGSIVVINTQTEKVFGYSREELLGKSVEMIVPQPYLDRDPANSALFFASAKVQSMGAGLDLYGQRKDGSQFPIEISQSPLQTETGMLVSSAIRDVTQRRAADELRFRLAAIVDWSDDAILSTDLDDVVTSWNRGAEALFGYSEREMIGRPHSVLLPPGHQGEGEMLLAQLQRGERVQNRDVIRRTKDGREITVSITVSPIRDADGVLVGASTVARDITERKNAEFNLASAKEDAETASREYEAFSYSVAHDLRAPLRALDGFSQILMQRYADHLDEAGLNYLKRICDSAQYMAGLIDSLLLLARVGKREIVQARVDLSLLAADTMARLQATTPDRDVEVAIEPGLVGHGDRGLLNIVFENLLGNAWKFSRNETHARIEFGLTRAGREPIYFIRDNGAGFDMEYGAKLFGVFQRLHTPTEFEGTGIGLATVQRIISRHGGRIWAEGSPGGGATFFFTLNPKGR
jgi:PAS domain S-box-containing protein